MLRVDQGVDLLLDRAAADELVHQDVFLLADAEGPIGRLVLDRRVPPAVEMHDVGRRGQGQAGAAGLQRQDEERHGLVLLERLHQGLAVFHRGLAVQHQTRATENLSEETRPAGPVISRNWVKTSIFSCRAATTSAISRRRRPFAAVFLRPDIVVQPLRGMIADLLQPHQHRQHDALALDALGLLQALRQVLDGLAVQRRLPAAEAAQRLDLGLVGQIGDDRLVGLHPAQDVGPHQLAQRAVGVVGPLGQALGVAGELLGVAQQARIDEVEDRPQIAEVIFDRRSGQRDPRLGLQRLRRFGLPGVRVLDRLRLVQDDEAPRRSQPSAACAAASRSW